MKSNRSKDSRKMSQTENFSDILRKMKAGKKTKLKIKTDDHFEDLEKQEQKDPNSHLIRLENQKQLIKLYQSNYTTVFENLKKDFDYNSRNLKTETYTKKPKDKFSFTQPKQKKPKYGFEQFNKTSYANSSCMKEFYDKYSQFNTLMRKHNIRKYTPSWAFI